MEPAHRLPLTPEQLATVDEGYVSAKIDEAYADPAGAALLDMAAVKAELHRRLKIKGELADEFSTVPGVYGNSNS